MDKNKIIFICGIGLVLTFIIGYGVFVMDEGDATETELKQTDVPELRDGQKEYNSKLEAVNDVKEVRKSNAPSIYDESFLDATGTFDPKYQENERQRIVDSIYRHGRINYESGTNGDSNATRSESGDGRRNSNKDKKSSAPDFSIAHRAFFDVVEKPEGKSFHGTRSKSDAFIMVEVNGEQTVRSDDRVELRLAVDALIQGDTVIRNSLVYGFVSFKANRVFIRITNIDNRVVDLKAFDLMDGNEGIYIKNSVQAEATGEVLDDIIQDINIPGVPQIGGIKKIFRRNNRTVKATIFNQYQLILKPSL